MSHLQMKLLRKKIEKRNAKLRQRNLKLQGELCRTPWWRTMSETQKRRGALRQLPAGAQHAPRDQASGVPAPVVPSLVHPFPAEVFRFREEARGFGLASQASVGKAFNKTYRLPFLLDFPIIFRSHVVLSV